MKHTLVALSLTIGLQCLLCEPAQSQHDTVSVKPVRIILLDGSELVGTVVSENEESIEFRTGGNITMSLPKKQVRGREVLSGEIIGGEYIRNDPNSTRLLFSPTARPLKSGQGYFSIYEIFFPMIAVGVANVATLAGGLTLFPGAQEQLFYFGPKITPVNMEKLSISGGLLYMRSTGGGTDGFGIMYGVTTLGTEKAALTAGLGWGFYGDETADRPILMIGGEVRASNSIKFISENWFPPGSDFSLLSFGIRFFGDNLAADLGFWYPAGARTSGFPFLPWIGFVYNFGTTR